MLALYCGMEDSEVVILPQVVLPPATLPLLIDLTADGDNTWTGIYDIQVCEENQRLFTFLACLKFYCIYFNF